MYSGQAKTETDAARGGPFQMQQADRRSAHRITLLNYGNNWLVKDCEVC